MHCEERMELPFRQPRYRARKLVELALLSGGDGFDSADAELMILCEELGGVPFVSVAELRFYAFLRRERRRGERALDVARLRPVLALQSL